MNRYGRGGSRATNATLCQKCLKRGHYSYECKAAAQERPYASRPSRTQQLKNPKLAPKLTNIALEDLLPKKTIADQELEKSTSGRRRMSLVDPMDGLQPSRKRSHSPSHSRSRSVSSYSSVSTISTRSSRSPPAAQRMRNHDQHSGREKRRRRASSASSSDDRSNIGAKSADILERNTRPRRSSTSPAERGRRRSRSVSADQRARRSSSIEAESRTITRKRRPSDESLQSINQLRSQESGDRDMSHSHAIERSDSRRLGALRERSLSPYSKRLALMQDDSARNMNAGE